MAGRLADFPRMFRCLLQRHATTVNLLYFALFVVLRDGNVQMDSGESRQNDNTQVFRCLLQRQATTGNLLYFALKVLSSKLVTYETYTFIANDLLIDNLLLVLRDGNVQTDSGESRPNDHINCHTLNCNDRFKAASPIR